MEEILQWMPLLKLQEWEQEKLCWLTEIRKKKMGAYGFEYDLAISAGVESLFNATPIAITGNGKVEGVKFAKTEIIDGKLQTNMNETFVIECDMVIKATGQAKQGHLYELIDDLEIDSKTRIITNNEFQTSNPKYFAGGDAINGGAEVVNAAYDGKMAAQGIHNWLTK